MVDVKQKWLRIEVRLCLRNWGIYSTTLAWVAWSSGPEIFKLYCVSGCCQRTRGFSRGSIPMYIITVFELVKLCLYFCFKRQDYPGGLIFSVVMSVFFVLQSEQVASLICVKACWQFFIACSCKEFDELENFSSLILIGCLLSTCPKKIMMNEVQDLVSSDERFVVPGEQIQLWILNFWGVLFHWSEFRWLHVAWIFVCVLPNHIKIFTSYWWLMQSFNSCCYILICLTDREVNTECMDQILECLLWLRKQSCVEISCSFYSLWKHLNIFLPGVCICVLSFIVGFFELHSRVGGH